MFVCVFFRYSVSTLDHLSCVALGFQMLESSLPYLGFVDGTIRSTQNLASVAWEIYSPTNKLISLHGVCLGRATNNIAEYSTVIELLTDAISLGVRCMVI